MAAFYNRPQQKIDFLFLSFSALAIIFLFCHCFASEALFWLYQMHLELKVYSLPAKIFFTLHWGYMLVINSGFPGCVTLSKEETWRTGVTTDTSSRTPKPAERRPYLQPLVLAGWQFHTSHLETLLGSWEMRGWERKVWQCWSFRRAGTDSTEPALFLLGFWEGPAVLRLSGHLIHTAGHTGSLFMEVKSLCPKPWHRQVANTSWTDLPGCLTAKQPWGVTCSNCSAHPY